MNTRKTNKMETMAMPALVLNMSLPIMVSLLVQSLYNIVDGIFVSRLSEAALTATSLAYPVQMLMIAVGVGTAVGLNAALSQTLGKKDLGEASRVAVTGLMLSALSAAVFTLAGLFAPALANHFTADAAIAGACGDYLRICMVFCLGNLLCMTFQRILQAAGNTLLSMAVLVCGAVTNVALDPVLIFGLLGCPALGIRGAAWATVIGQWVSMLLGLWLCLRKTPTSNSPSGASPLIWAGSGPSTGWACPPSSPRLSTASWSPPSTPSCCPSRPRRWPSSGSTASYRASCSCP